ncbi:MAG: hypothetical protein SGARI_003074 [Bacillariaceae sp.]
MIDLLAQEWSLQVTPDNDEVNELVDRPAAYNKSIVDIVQAFLNPPKQQLCDKNDPNGNMRDCDDVIHNYTARTFTDSVTIQNLVQMQMLSDGGGSNYGFLYMDTPFGNCPCCFIMIGIGCVCDNCQLKNGEAQGKGVRLILRQEGGSQDNMQWNPAVMSLLFCGAEALATETNEMHDEFLHIHTHPDHPLTNRESIPLRKQMRLTTIEMPGMNYKYDLGTPLHVMYITIVLELLKFHAGPQPYTMAEGLNGRVDLKHHCASAFRSLMNHDEVKRVLINVRCVGYHEYNDTLSDTMTRIQEGGPVLTPPYQEERVGDDHSDLNPNAAKRLRTG